MARTLQCAGSLATALLLAAACQPNTPSGTAPPADEASVEGGGNPTMDEAESPPRPMARRPPVTSDGREFMRTAEHANTAEIELSRVALNKTTSEPIRAFAQRMIHDHGQARDELEEMARRDQVKLPRGLSHDAKKKKAELEKLSGQAFDSRYVDIMVDDHHQAVNLFREETHDQDNPEVQQWAAKILPTLEDHLRRIQMISEGKTPPQASASTPKAPTKTAMHSD